MSEEVQIEGTNSTAKIRGVVAVPVLGIITLEIYSFVWYYKINREMADLGRATVRGDELGEKPGLSLLAITLGALLIVPPFVSYVRSFRRVQALQRLTGASGPINGWIGLILFIVFSPALQGYVQSGLNSAWRSQAPQGRDVE